MLTRRHLLSVTGSAATMLALGPVRLALADAPTDARFVLAIQRGAMDGLHAVPPYGDPNYKALRVNLALSDDGGTDGVLDLDGKFGLHPKLTELKAWYDKGELTVVHAVATPYRERSHFDGQDLLENGTIQPHASASGWLNRTLDVMGGVEGSSLGIGTRTRGAAGLARQDRGCLLGAGQPAGGRTRFPEPRAGDVCEAADARRHLAPGDQRRCDGGPGDGHQCRDDAAPPRQCRAGARRCRRQAARAAQRPAHRGLGAAGLGHAHQPRPRPERPHGGGFAADERRDGGVEDRARSGLVEDRGDDRDRVRPHRPPPTAAAVPITARQRRSSSAAAPSTASV